MQKVSILIAVRNEEANIKRCLDALEALTYPTSHLQILIGNDDSTDATGRLIAEFRAGKAHIELHHIMTKIGAQAGKGNVLAQLAQKATGAYWLVTDADIAVSPNWVQDALETIENKTMRGKEVGIASHLTWIETKGIFSACQALEWTWALGTFAFLGYFGIGLTTQGNNMALKAEAYKATGGYEAMPFSITEDFALFWAIRRQGYTFLNVVHDKAIVTSLPAPTWEALFKQHRRWLVGALELNIFWKGLLLLRTFLLPLLVLLFFALPALAVGIAISNTALSFLTLAITLYRAGKLRYISYFPFFILYQEILLLGTFFYYLLQKSVEWKGRKY